MPSKKKFHFRPLKQFDCCVMGNATANALSKSMHRQFLKGPIFFNFTDKCWIRHCSPLVYDLRDIPLLIPNSNQSEHSTDISTGQTDDPVKQVNFQFIIAQTCKLQIHSCTSGLFEYDVQLHNEFSATTGIGKLKDTYITSNQLCNTSGLPK